VKTILPVRSTQASHMRKLWTAQSFLLPRGHKLVFVAHV